MIKIESKFEKFKNFLLNIAPSDATFTFRSYDCWIDVPLDEKEYKCVSYTLGSTFDREYTFQEEDGTKFSFECDDKPSDKTLRNARGAVIKRKVRCNFSLHDTEEEITQKMESLINRDTSDKFNFFTKYKIQHFVLTNGKNASSNSIWKILSN